MGGASLETLSCEAAGCWVLLAAALQQPDAGKLLPW